MKIIVIGAGLIGLTSAYFLGLSGHEVTVIDRADGPARETSFANGSLLTPSMCEPWNAPGSWRVLLKSLGRADSAMQLHLRALPGLGVWGCKFLRYSTRAAFRKNALSNLHLAGTPDEVTLFKSVGAAIEDLAAARIVVASDQSARRNKRPS